jgi:hypothetical protein
MKLLPDDLKEQALKLFPFPYDVKDLLSTPHIQELHSIFKEAAEKSYKPEEVQNLFRKEEKIRNEIINRDIDRKTFFYHRWLPIYNKIS